MLVSVIIPAYNAASTIEDTIRSVFDQELPEDQMEVIIVNDGSKDNTEQMLRSYDGVCKIVHTENRGVSSARNTGFALSTGKYIQYLDSDDLLAKGKLKSQIEKLEHTFCDVAYGDWQRFKEAEGQVKYMDIVSQTLSERPELDLLVDHWWPPLALLYTRRIAEKIGDWHASLPIIQDARYQLDAAIHGAKFCHVPEVVGYYRTDTEGSLSKRDPKAFMNDVFLNVREVYELWKDELEYDHDKKTAIIKVLSYCTNEFSKFNYREFRKAIDLIKTIQPDYQPQGSLMMKLLSKIIGYKRAEYIASIKRRIR